MRNQERDEMEKLLDWVKEYEIEDEIRDRLIESGYESAVKFVFTYIDDGAYCEKIVAYYCI